MTTARKSIGARRIPLHDHRDLNSGGKLGFSQAIEGGLEIITGSIPPSDTEATPQTTESVVDHEEMGATETLDITQGTWHRGTLDADCTITVSGFTADVGLVVIFEVVQDGVGGWDITWDPDVSFISESGSPSQGAGDTTMYGLFTSAGDSTIYAFKVGSSVGALDELSDVTLTSPVTDDDLRFNGTAWVNDSRKWETVTGGEDVFVWDGDDLVYDWST